MLQKVTLKYKKIVLLIIFILSCLDIYRVLVENKFGAFEIFILLVVLFLILVSLVCKFDNKKFKSDKITFLLLHLGYGGIESATINSANALVDSYDVEIISFYNLSKNQSNKLDKKISVKYLYNGEPNKEIFVSSLKKHQYFKVIKEGIKAVTILFKKKYLMIFNIMNCNSKYIVSTRYDFSILLSRYGNKNQIKIAQEHHYHNNNQKYINILKRKYNNIDYLCALTKTLEQDYKQFLIKNKHTKVILLPNMVGETPTKTSLLEKKNVITVSRLDNGKKNDDIIRAFSKLNTEYWKLYIIGDGREYENLLNLIEELRLKEKVFLTGYKNKNEIEKYMLNSSLFLMASLTEGLPMVLLEAMSYGVPCIAYETASGVSDIIENGKNGYIIKDRNEKNFISKIETLINDEKLRKAMGMNARKTVTSFSKEEILKIWQKMLK